MRRPRLQYGGVYLDKRYGIWYYRRSKNGKRELQPIGKLVDYPTKAKARQAAQALIETATKIRASLLKPLLSATWRSECQSIRQRMRVTAITWRITAFRAGAAWN